MLGADFGRGAFNRAAVLRLCFWLLFHQPFLSAQNLLRRSETTIVVNTFFPTIAHELFANPLSGQITAFLNVQELIFDLVGGKRVEQGGNSTRQFVRRAP